MSARSTWRKDSVQAKNSAKATTVVVLWFAFVNLQFLFAILCLVRWRLVFPRMSLGQARCWDGALFSSPPGVALLVASGLLLGAGLVLPWPWFRYHNRQSEGSFEGPVLPVLPFVARFVHFSLVSALGVALGFSRGNPTLAAPFLAVATAVLVACYPTAHRLKRALTAR